MRAVVKTFAKGFGLELVEVPHSGGTTDPDRVAQAAQGAAAVIFQQPNFFGCFEPAPELAAAANASGALPIAHVDLISLGVLEAPGNYGCALAIGEGQSAGTFMSYGGPHYGFLAAKEPYMRRMPGRIVGETVDSDGERGYVLTLQTREQHIRREKATSNITTNQTLLALAGLVHLSLLGPQGLRETAETCMALAGLRARDARRPRARAAFPRPADLQGVRARHRPRRRRRGRARGASRAASTPATRSGATTPSSPSGLLVARHREAHVRRDRPPRRDDRRDEADLRTLAPGPARARRARPRAAGPAVPAGLARQTPPRLPELAEPEVIRHFTELSTRNFGIDTGFYPLGSCTMKYNPRVNERLAALPGFRDLHPLVPDEAAQGALELEWRLAQILAEVTGLPAVSLQPAAGSQGELTGLLLMQAYFEASGEGERRRKIVIPDTAHGTNPASVAMTGYELTRVKTDARGNIDLDDLAAEGRRRDGRADADEPLDARALRREHRGDPRRLPRAPARSCTTTAPT